MVRPNEYCLRPPLYSFMRSWIINMGREMIPCAVGTIEYLIVNEQVVEQAILQFVTKIGSFPTIVS